MPVHVCHVPMGLVYDGPRLIAVLPEASRQDQRASGWGFFKGCEHAAAAWGLGREREVLEAPRVGRVEWGARRETASCETTLRFYGVACIGGASVSSPISLVRIAVRQPAIPPRSLKSPGL